MIVDFGEVRKYSIEIITIITIAQREVLQSGTGYAVHFRRGKPSCRETISLCCCHGHNNKKL